MRTTIVFAHPRRDSLNGAILDKVTNKRKGEGDKIILIDLYKDGFDPVMSEKDLSLYSQGKSSDPMVVLYNAILDNTEKIFFLFPIWWYDMPAILRGFFDKVMLQNSAYIEDEKGLHPIRNIQNTVIITTSAEPTESIINSFGDPINRTIITGTFNAIGFFNAKWYNIGDVNRKTIDMIDRDLKYILEQI